MPRRYLRADLGGTGGLRRAIPPSGSGYDKWPILLIYRGPVFREEVSLTECGRGPLQGQVNRPPVPSVAVSSDPILLLVEDIAYVERNFSNDIDG